MSFTASARPLEGGLRHEVDVNSRHTLVTDEPERLGGTDSGPAPHELLAAMLAACASTMVALYARRHGWPVEGLRVDVEISLQLPAGLSPEQVARLSRVAATCPVRRAFEAGFDFEEHLITGAPDRAAA